MYNQCSHLKLDYIEAKEFHVIYLVGGKIFWPKGTIWVLEMLMASPEIVRYCFSITTISLSWAASSDAPRCNFGIGVCCLLGTVGQS